MAPIALYPDPLLAQIFMASTYPLEVVQAARFVKANSSLKDPALSEELKKYDWDDSVKSLVSFPQVLTMMDDKLDWTQKLGDAFLDQQAETMDAVQRLRAKAQGSGNLKSTPEQVVAVEPAPADMPTSASTPRGCAAAATAAARRSSRSSRRIPQVVYVPTYNPTVVYGAWPYPAYPPYAYYPTGIRGRNGALLVRRRDGRRGRGVGELQLGRRRRQHQQQQLQQLHQEREQLESPEPDQRCDRGNGSRGTVGAATAAAVTAAG